MKVTLKTKIVGLAVVSAILPLLVIFCLLVRLENTIVTKASVELDQLGRENVTQVAHDVLNLCKMSHEIVQRQIVSNMQVARNVMEQQGAPVLGEERIEWRAVNQETGQDIVTVSLPKLMLGTQWIGRNTDPGVPTPVVDDVVKITGMVCSLFQRMNEKGDMLRVASSVLSKDNTRFIDSYYPSVSKNGQPNEFIQMILQKKDFTGLTYLSGGGFFIAGYTPITNTGGVVIGMLGVGLKVEELDEVRSVLRKTKVGKTGYVWAVGTKGDKRGVYLVSKEGQRDGENIWESKDSTDGTLFIQNIVNTAVKSPPGTIHYQRYMWQNPGDPMPRAKIAAFSYFEPWDWVLAAGTYEDDFYEATHHLKRETRASLVDLSVACGIAFVVVSLMAIGVVIRLTRPLGVVIRLADKIAEGNVQDALQDIDAYMNKTGRTPEAAAKGKRQRDEITQLLLAFRAMAGGLSSLIGQVQRSGIQVTTSTTQIAASARQLEATVAEQAASTREISSTTKTISSTAEQLVQTMSDVARSVDATAVKAESQRTQLMRMESAIRQLIQASGSISAKLGIINDKTNKISSVVTTINKVSDQTNLLSLNAAIEAEKAGEYGKGFAVVARETSRLADQTAIATQDIEHMVQEMQTSVSAGVMEMDKFSEEVRRGVQEVAQISEQMSKVIDDVHGLGPMFDNVKNEMHNQKEGAQQISDAMNQLSIAADQNREALHEFKSAAEQLNAAVQGLKNEITRFRTAS